MILCSMCARGHHTGCLQPALTAVPPGDWFCAACPDGRPLRNILYHKTSLNYSVQMDLPLDSSGHITAVRASYACSYMASAACCTGGSVRVAFAVPR